jgi:two-component system, cell cycle response regulator DivK
MSVRPHSKPSDKRRSRSAARLVSTKSRKTASPKPRRPTILVADDDLDARTMYGLYLKSMGCAVYTATDGAGAFNQATAVHPDVIVLDLAMPHVDGWAAAERLRRSPITRHIPIIALTAIPGARDSAHLSGCDAFMSKPCLPQLLWCEVRALLGLDSPPADSTTDPSVQPG